MSSVLSPVAFGSSTFSAVYSTSGVSHSAITTLTCPCFDREVRVKVFVGFLGRSMMKFPSLEV